MVKRNITIADCLLDWHLGSFVTVLMQNTVACAAMASYHNIHTVMEISARQIRNNTRFGKSRRSEYQWNGHLVSNPGVVIPPLDIPEVDDSCPSNTISSHGPGAGLVLQKLQDKLSGPGKAHGRNRCTTIHFTIRVDLIDVSLTLCPGT